jgi:hypothetical protein
VRCAATPPGCTEACRYDPAVILDAATDGGNVILGMLIVGLIFLGVIGLGELVRAAGHRRQARRP